MCPSCATSFAFSFEPTREMSDRSAPAARMYCLPVMPTAWISPAAARALSASSVAPSSVSVVGPERVRPVVVAPVVERDEREHLARGEADVAHGRVRDDLALGEGEERGEVDVCVIRQSVRPCSLRFLPS